MRNTSIGQAVEKRCQNCREDRLCTSRAGSVFDGCILLTVLTVVAVSISSFEMARQVFQMDVPRLELATLDELFVDLAREFERSLGRKLETINHPRLSLCKSERSFDLPGHRVVFSSTLAAKFRAAEHLHSAPSDVLRYGLGSLRRLRNLVGNDCQLVKRNSSGDWSVLSPIAVLSVDVESEALFAGELVLPLTGASGGPLRVFRFDNSLPLTNVAGTTLRHTPHDIGKVWMVQGRKFLSLTLAADLPVWSSHVEPGDELVVRGYWLEVVKVEVIRPGELFVDINRPCPFSNSEKRPSPARLAQVVRAHGCQTTVPCSDVRLYSSAGFVFRSNILSVSIHSFSVNGGGYLTVRKYIPTEDVPSLPLMPL